MVFPSWPWTDFHKDNQDWLIKTVKECKALVQAYTDDVEDLKTRMTASEGAITDLQGRMTTVESYGPRITALENMHPGDVWIKNVGGTLSYGYGSYADADKIINSILSNQMQNVSSLGVIFYRPGNISEGRTALLPTSYNVHPDMHDTYFTIEFGSTITVELHQDGTIVSV